MKFVGVILFSILAASACAPEKSIDRRTSAADAVEENDDEAVIDPDVSLSLMKEAKKNGSKSPDIKCSPVKVKIVGKPEYPNQFIEVVVEKKKGAFSILFATASADGQAWKPSNKSPEVADTFTACMPHDLKGKTAVWVFLHNSMDPAIEATPIQILCMRSGFEKPMQELQNQYLKGKLTTKELDAKANTFTRKYAIFEAEKLRSMTINPMLKTGCAFQD